MKEMTSWHIINVFLKTVKETILKAVKEKDICIQKGKIKIAAFLSVQCKLKQTNKNQTRNSVLKGKTLPS